MNNKKIYFFFGTTAELIKLIPVIKELKKRKIDFKLITSGQGKILFSEFTDFVGPLKGNINLVEKENKSSVFFFILWAIKATFTGMFALKKEFKGLNKNNSYLIIHGDTVSSLIGAVLAKRYGLKIVHIESGLRSFNFLEPFPEELSRHIVSYLTDIHFAPNKWAVTNLKKMPGVKINTKQNTLLETFWMAMKVRSYKRSVKKINGKYFVLVMHRQEHVIWGKKEMKNLLEYILENMNSDLTCVFMTHDITLSFLDSTEFNLGSDFAKKIAFITRLSYIEFMKLIQDAEFIITDGGSNQEEMYYMGKPCLLLRNYTERIEGLGENVVLSKGNKQIIKNFLKKYKTFKRKTIPISIAPSKIIIDYLIKQD
jgi:UDP-N-acetylglucosamine 2-epimerase (non-hydrolysing)